MKGFRKDGYFFDPTLKLLDVDHVMKVWKDPYTQKWYYQMYTPDRVNKIGSQNHLKRGYYKLLEEAL